ncbi:hypothetical protein GCM10007301_09360 [Azorhizobium oxalatiphilum]|uniref:Uncharacterized protein n=1 Tax=Azorhizobium oxalatiphilum TaxID=980631 RepID=A0A917F5J3_9HYPH|nr:hypothetical protein [Azorhizobium oxalatiphilum]GGF52022.1 hypothetical protein GCM10007301_09360 [Azorhizobium oxalatiphilum]
MNVALEFASASPDELKAALAGGTLTLYSVARPASADHPVTRSGVLATLTFAAPAFGEATDAGETPLFVANPVTGAATGTFGFARLTTADGKVVADVSAGAGPRELKLAEVSAANGGPVRVVGLRFLPEAAWPERPDYFNTHPRAGYPLHKAG